MFQIKYKGEFLVLPSDASTEVERHSPFFLIDSVWAEKSLPITIPACDTNARLLGFFFFELTVRTRQKLDVEIYDGGNYKCNGILVIESAGMNSRFANKGNAGGYLLIGISNFYTQIKDKKLSSLSLGGDRVF
ncbi:MAG TPA: hypothetical protein PL045_05955, partial [Chitinophagaceae bacterium]|nr:hypothetical protein [Chitinophagaceae bacterium]